MSGERSTHLRRVRGIWARAWLLAGATLLAAPAASAAETDLWRLAAAGDPIVLAGLSPAQEAKIGADEHPKVLEAYGGAYESGTIGAFAAVTAGHLISNTELAGAPFRITVLNSPVVNAFALPGGYVYVTRGLMALANSEEEFAGVLAHEIGHVVRRHAAQRMDAAQTVGILGTLGTIGALILGGESAGQLAQSLIGALGQGYILKYSREQEYEADRVGVTYLARTGYDPYAMATFLGQMDKMSALEAKIAGQQYDPNRVDYFSTHPNTQDRARQAVQQALSTGVGQQQRPRRVESYLALLDGAVFGDSREQGLVRNGTFYHPDLHFAFKVPKGWRLQNAPEAIVLAGPSSTVVQFDGGKVRSAGDMGRYVQSWGSELKVPISNIERYSVNGMPAATGTSNVTYQNRATQLRLVAIDFGGNQIYRFLILVPRSAVSSMNPTLQSLTSSFRRLSASEAANVKPFHIQIHTVRSGDTVASLSARMAMSEFRDDWFRVLNDIEAGAPLQAGRKVKLVVE
ncbi:MAG: M48 family metalloprotease [Alphaproteobacteria bacterium]|nr:M48 family metalloprotease [Alphaproteobacteria bacterium]